MTPKERNLSDIGLIALRHGVTRHDILNRHGKRCPKVHAARKAVALHFRAKEHTWTQIGRVVGRDHSTVMFWAGFTKPSRGCGKLKITAQLEDICAKEKRPAKRSKRFNGPNITAFEER